MTYAFIPLTKSVMSRSPKGVVVQSLSRVWLFATPWATAHKASLSFIIFWSLLKLMSFEMMMPSNHLILCRPLLLLLLIFPSIRVFSNESALSIRWSKYWNFSSASVLPVNIQGWFPLGLTGLNALLSKGLLRVPFWLWLLFQLAAAFSAALSYLGVSLLQGLLTCGFSSFLLFSGISPLLLTLWAALSLSDILTPQTGESDWTG